MPSLEVAVGALEASAKRRKLEKEEEEEVCKVEEETTTASEPDQGFEVGPKPPKAYGNSEFLNSSSARLIRVMCELEEPKARLAAEGVDNIIMFFGSARAKPEKEYKAAVKEAEEKAKADPQNASKRASLERLQKQAFLIPMFEAVEDLSKMLTQWSMKRAAEAEAKAQYVVGTGAGPGMMTAANRGAHLGGGRSVGFGISLPFGDGLNPYVTPDLGFEFHYFFTRKFWMSYKCMGLVVAPGGLGTCDELFEVITLMQTGKIKRQLPVILIGRKFWQACINWQAFVDYGMISEQDASQLIFADTAEEAFPHLVAGIERLEAADRAERQGLKK